MTVDTSVKEFYLNKQMDSQMVLLNAVHNLPCFYLILGENAVRQSNISRVSTAMAKESLRNSVKQRLRAQSLGKTSADANSKVHIKVGTISKPP